LSPILFALGRFRTAPSGLRFRSSAADLNPLPLLSSGCPSPRSFTSTYRPHPHARASAPLLGFCPLQRSTESGVRIPAGPTAGTVRPQGFSPSRRLAPPETMQGLFHPRCALGFSRPKFASNGPFDPAGATSAGVLFTAFSSPVTDTFWRALPSGASQLSFADTLSGHVASGYGRCTVLITGESVYPKVASRGHQPS